MKKRSYTGIGLVAGIALALVVLTNGPGIAQTEDVGPALEQQTAAPGTSGSRERLAALRAEVEARAGELAEARSDDSTTLGRLRELRRELASARRRYRALLWESGELPDGALGSACDLCTGPGRGPGMGRGRMMGRGMMARGGMMAAGPGPGWTDRGRCW